MDAATGAVLELHRMSSEELRRISSSVGSPRDSSVRSRGRMISGSTECSIPLSVTDPLSPRNGTRRRLASGSTECSTRGMDLNSMQWSAESDLDLDDEDDDIASDEVHKANAACPPAFPSNSASGARQNEPRLVSADTILPAEFSSHPANVIFANPDHIFLRAPSTDAVIPVSRHLRKLVSYVLLFTQRPFDFLERKIEHHKRRLVNATLSVSFHSSSPLSILLHRRAVALLMLLIASLHLFFTISDLVRVEERVVGSAFRLSSRQLRNGNTSPQQPQVEDFVVLQEAAGLWAGCLQELAPRSLTAQGPDLVASFEEETIMDGFLFVLSQHSAELDPVRVEVSVATKDEGGWRVVGFQSVRRAQTGQLKEGPDLSGDMQRGETVVVDLRASQDWAWYLGRGVGGLGMGLGLLVGGVTGLAGMAGRGGVVGLLLSWGVAAVAMLTGGVHLVAVGRGGEGGMWLMYGVVVGGGTAALRWRERSLTTVLLAVGGGLLAADMLSSGALIGRGGGDVGVTAGHGMLGAVMVAGGLLLWVVSLSQHRAVTRLLAADKAAYAEAWGEMRGREGFEAGLARLERVVAVAGWQEGGTVMQSQRIVVQGARGVGMDGEERGGRVRRVLWWVQNAWSTLVYDMPHESEILEPLRNIDQIYAQATCLRPILKSKVQQWAMRSGGMFATQDGEFARWEDARQSVEQRRLIGWTALKKEGRAIEKVIRCYGEDVSRLVDVCRQSIVFETVGELADCLETIANDQEVEVVRVKNRMRVEEDGAASAGFRSVSVNMRLRAEDARSFGVDTHVCELQLLTKDFAKLQAGEGRKSRYQLFRDFQRPGPSQLLRLPFAGWLMDRMAGIWTEGEQDVGRMLLLRKSGWGRSASGGSEDSMESGSVLPCPWGRSADVDQRASSSGRRRSSMEVLLKSSFLDFSMTARGFGFNGSGNNRIFRRFSLVRLSQHTFRERDRRNSREGTLSVRDEVLRAYLQLMHRRNTSTKGRKGHLLDFWKAMEAVSASSVLFIRHPVQGLLTKQAWRIFGLGLCVAGLAMCLGVFWTFMQNHGYTYPIYRLSVLGNRSFPAGPAIAVGLDDFGLADEGCPVLDRPKSRGETTTELILRFFRPVRMDGLWVRTSTNESTEVDPVRFMVEGSDDGTAWAVAGASAYVNDLYMPLRWLDRFNDLTYERGSEVFVGKSHIQKWMDALIWQAPVPSFLAILVAVLRAYYGNLQSIGLLVSGMVLGFAAMMATGFVVWVHYQPFVGQHMMILSPIFLIIGLTIWFKQRYFYHAGTAAMIWGVAARHAHHLMNGEDFRFLLDYITYMMLTVLGASIGAALIRLHILHASRRMVNEDKKRYDKLWAELKLTQADALRRVEDVAQLQRMNLFANEIPRHTYSQAIVSGWHPGVRAGDTYRSAARKKVPIMDIDQIYAQAVCLHPILLRKVQEWALLSGGMFATPDGGFVRWDEAVEHGQRVKWGSIKKEGRAIEKVIRCYGEDVSRLVDVCRQNIVFETVGELADCLEVIANDGEVEVVRAKNRMRVEEDGAASAGFRNVSVNMRLRAEDARSFGVDTHVCELQLLTKDFAKLQKAEGHKRYVRFRNVRGE